jgi:adenylate cyclase class IV
MKALTCKNNSEVQKADKEYQKDLFYRYSVYLLKKGDFQQAENIISTHLNFKSADIEKLRDVIKAEKVNIALNQITQINRKIEQLYDNSLSTEELSTFYNSLDSIVSSLKLLTLNFLKRF